MKSGKRRIISMLMAAAMVMAMLPATLLAGNVSDVEGHWGQAAIEKWTGYGVLSGYADGTFRPERLITRAEVAKILDTMLGYQQLGDVTFTDVPAGEWYSESIQRLAAAGVMQGAAGQARPGDNITRQEAVSLIARAFQIGQSTATESFVDEGLIASWALDAVQNMKDAGYIRGDENGFRPTQSIKRAELVTIINNLFAAYYNQAGTYTEAAAGNVAVAADGVVLKDMEIAGDLYVLQGVGDGDARFENVTVKGKTYVWGGGANTVYFLNSSLNQLTAEKEDVRVVIDGGSAGQVDVPAGTAQLRGAAEVGALNVGENGVASVAAEAAVETASVAGGQLENQGTINQLEQEGGTVVNGGTLQNATLSGDVSFESTAAGTIGQLTVGAETATDATIKLDSPVKGLTVDAGVAITGGGKIDTANVNADGVAFDTKPAEVKVGEDVTVPPAGEQAPPADQSGGSDDNGSGYQPVPSTTAAKELAKIKIVAVTVRQGQDSEEEVLAAAVAAAQKQVRSGYTVTFEIKDYESDTLTLIGKFTVTKGEDTAEDDADRTMSVTVLEPTRIRITFPNKRAYYVGEELDLTGMIITAEYADGSSRVIPNDDEDVKVSGFNSNEPVASQTITITYEGFEPYEPFEYPVKIKEEDRTQITVTNEPTVVTTKVYDGTVAAVVTDDNAAVYGGIEEGAKVNVTATAVFNSKDVGTGKTVTVTYTLSGDDAGKYLAPVDGTIATDGSILEKELTIANVTATYVPSYVEGEGTVTVSSGTLVGKIPGDDVTLTGTATAALKEGVGIGDFEVHPVIVTGYTLDGTAKGNYKLTQPTGLTVDSTVVLATITLDGEDAHNNVIYGNTIFLAGLNLTGTLKYHEEGPTDMGFANYDHHFLVFTIHGLKDGATVKITGLANSSPSETNYTLTGLTDGKEVFIWGVEDGETTITIVLDRDGSGNDYEEETYVLNLASITLESAPSGD